MMTEPAPASEAAESIFPNNNPPASLYCAEAGAPPSSPYPILHLPSLPQHHLGNMAQRPLSSERIRDLDNLAGNGYLLEIFTENVDRSILQISFRLIFYHHSMDGAGVFLYNSILIISHLGDWLRSVAHVNCLLLIG